MSGFGIAAGTITRWALSDNAALANKSAELPATAWALVLTPEEKGSTNEKKCPSEPRGESLPQTHMQNGAGLCVAKMRHTEKTLHHLCKQTKALAPHSGYSVYSVFAKLVADTINGW